MGKQCGALAVVPVEGEGRCDVVHILIPLEPRWILEGDNSWWWWWWQHWRDGSAGKSPGCSYKGPISDPSTHIGRLGTVYHSSSMGDPSVGVPP